MTCTPCEWKSSWRPAAALRYPLPVWCIMQRLLSQQPPDQVHWKSIMAKFIFILQSPALSGSSISVSSFVVRDYYYYVPPSSSSQHNAILFITITATSVASLTHNHTRNSFLPIKSISYLIDQSYIRENIGCHTTITHYYTHYIYNSSTRHSSCFCFPIICIG